jgi:hypothetical protein
MATLAHTAILAAGQCGLVHSTEHLFSFEGEPVSPLAPNFESALECVMKWPDAIFPSQPDAQFSHERVPPNRVSTIKVRYVDKGNGRPKPYPVEE